MNNLFAHRCRCEPVAVQEAQGPNPATLILYRCVACRFVHVQVVAGRWTIADVRGEAMAEAKAAIASLIGEKS